MHDHRSAAMTLVTEPDVAFNSFQFARLARTAPCNYGFQACTGPAWAGGLGRKRGNAGNGIRGFFPNQNDGRICI